MEKRSVRHEAIRTLINAYAIENQEQLSKLLFAQCGIQIDQSSLSRDLKEIGCFKTRNSSGTLIYELPGQERHGNLVRSAIMSIESNEAMIVIKTLAGMAAFVGDYLDAHATELHIIATLAGENTVLVVPRSVRRIERVLFMVRAQLFIKQNE